MLFRSAFSSRRNVADFLCSGGIGRQLAWATDIETIAPPRKGRLFGPFRQHHARVTHCSYSQSTFDRPHFIP